LHGWAKVLVHPSLLCTCFAKVTLTTRCCPPSTPSHRLPLRSALPAVKRAGAVQVPLTSVAVESPFDYWPIFHYMGEKQAIRFVDAPALATDNACIHKQQSKSYTKMNTVRGQLRWDGAHWISNGSYHVHPIGLAACQSCSCTANGSVGVLTNTSVIHNCNATKGPCSCRNGTHHAWLDRC